MCRDDDAGVGVGEGDDDADGYDDALTNDGTLLEVIEYEERKEMAVCLPACLPLSLG